MKRCFWILLFLASCKAATPLLATTYHVAKTGTAANCAAATGWTPATPTAAFLLTVPGVNCLAAGDTLIVHAGTYDETWEQGLTVSFPNGTSEATRTHIQAYVSGGVSDVVWLKSPYAGVGLSGNHQGIADYTANYMEFDHINVDMSTTTGVSYPTTGATRDVRCMRLDASFINWINSECKNANMGMLGGGNGRFINLHIHDLTGDTGCTGGCTGYAYYIPTSNNVVDHNDIHDLWGGIYVYNGSGAPADNNVFSNNKIYRTGRSYGVDPAGGGLTIGSGTNNVALNNVIFANYIGTLAAAYCSGGAQGSCPNNQLLNNTIYGNATSTCLGTYNVSGTVIRNNICYGNASESIDERGTGTTQDHNLFGPNPLFVNAGANNFHLCVSAGSPVGCTSGPSPAIGAGANLTGTCTGCATDPDGVARGATWDIGAFESGGAVSPPNTPPLEDFVYTTSATLAGQNGGTNFTGPWTDQGCGVAFTVAVAPGGSFSGGNAATSAGTGQACADRAFTAVGTGSVIWQMSKTVTTGYSAVTLSDSAGNRSANVALQADGHIHACADYPGDIDLGLYTAGQVYLIEAQFDAASQSMKARYRVNEGVFTAWTPFCVNAAAQSLVDHIGLFDNTAAAHSFSVDTIGAKSTAVHFSSGPPAMVTSGVPFSTTVDVVYSDGVTKHASATDTISIAICTGSPAATLTGTTTLAATAGAAIFNLTLTQPAGAVGVTLCATSTTMGLLGDESIPITIPNSAIPVTAVPALVRARIRAR